MPLLLIFGMLFAMHVLSMPIANEGLAAVVLETPDTERRNRCS